MPPGQSGRRWRRVLASLTALREMGYLGPILLGALIVRLLGVARGLPYIHEYDEPTVMSSVIGMLQRRDLNPVTFVYPSLYYYMLLPVMQIHYLYLHALGRIGSPQEIQVFHPQAIGTVYGWYINHPSFYLWGRTLTAVIGAATVFLVYRLGRAAYGSTVGLLAAALLSVAPGAVYFSDTLRVDAPMAFLVTAAMLAGLCVQGRGARTDYVLAGLLAGLAVSTKLNAAVVCLPLALAHFVGAGRTRSIDLNLLLMVLCALVGFVGGTPYILITHDATYAWLRAQALAYGVTPGLSDITRALPTYLAYLVLPSQGTEWYVVPHAGLGLVPGLAALAGLIAGFARRPRVHLYIASFPILFLLYMAGQRLIVLRSVLPMLPFAALFAAVGTVWSWQRCQAWWPRRPGRHYAVAATGIAILLAGPAGASVRLAWTMRQPDTRTAAVRWLQHNVPPGARVAFEEDLRWFLPDLHRLPFTRVFAPRDAALGWYLQHRTDYAVVGNRSALSGGDPAAIVIHRPPYIPNPGANWPQDGYPVIDPDVSIVRTAPPLQGAPGEIIAEPVLAEPHGVFSETTRVPDQPFAPGAYTLTVTGAWPWRWASPSRPLDVRVQVGQRTVDTTTIRSDRPLRFTTPRFQIDRAETLPVQVDIALRAADLRAQGARAQSGWAFRPTPTGCAAVGDAPSLNLRRLTVEAWVYLDSIPTPARAPWRPEPVFSAPVVSKGPFAGGYILGLSASRPDAVWVDFAVARHLERAGFTAVRKWTHIAATADGYFARIYVNGVAAPRDPNQPATYRGGMMGPGAPLLIGCVDPRTAERWRFSGLITLVRVWSRALSPAEIRDEASLRRLPDDSPGLAGSWSFRTSAGGTVVDASPAHNDIVNGALLHRVPIMTGTSALPSWTVGGFGLVRSVSVNRVSP